MTVAKALKRIEPEGRVITLEGQLPDGSWQAEHYGLLLNGAVIDGAGYSRSGLAWGRSFAKREDLRRPYRVTDLMVESDEAPDDPPTEKLLAAALRKVLAGETA